MDVPSLGASHYSGREVDASPEGTAGVVASAKERPRVGTRLAIALVLSVVAALLTFYKISHEPGGIAADYTWYWRAARVLLAGHSPYAAIVANGPYPFDAGFNYPLTTALLVVPVSGLPPAIASGILMGIGTFLLAFGITREGYHRLPLFGSVPFFVCLESVQLTPLVAAAALLPAAGWLAAIKPNVGLAAFVYNPTVMAIAGSATFVALSLIVSPGWPLEWLATVRQRAPGNYGSPLIVPGGIILLLSVLRWRRPEARLLLVMSIVPQSLLFTDQLMLWLIPRTRNESMLLSILSLPAMFIGVVGVPTNPIVADWSRTMGPAIVALLYLPCLIMVMRRPNEGNLPRWLSFRRQSA